MTCEDEVAVAQGESRLQKPAPTLNDETSTLLGSTATRGNPTSRNPVPALLNVFVPAAEFKFTAVGVGAYGPDSEGWLSNVYANSLGWVPTTKRWRGPGCGREAPGGSGALSSGL
jgi:hypothetical protein